MCSGSEAGSYSRLIDFFVTLNSRLESKKKGGVGFEEKKGVCSDLSSTRALGQDSHDRGHNYFT